VWKDGRANGHFEATVLVQHFGLGTTFWEKTGNWGENGALGRLECKRESPLFISHLTEREALEEN
jgi:hypothetical protein